MDLQQLKESEWAELPELELPWLLPPPTPRVEVLENEGQEEGARREVNITWGVAEGAPPYHARAVRVLRWQLQCRSGSDEPVDRVAQAGRVD